jgi:hypothetical protein
MWITTWNWKWRSRNGAGSCKRKEAQGLNQAESLKFNITKIAPPNCAQLGGYFFYPQAIAACFGVL